MTLRVSLWKPIVTPSRQAHGAVAGAGEFGALFSSRRPTSWSDQPSLSSSRSSALQVLSPSGSPGSACRRAGPSRR